ncbi:hypothetical protein Tco_0688582 [Tanacetum coccineum]
MSTQQDIYAAGFEYRPPILNKDNYVSWSSRRLCYAKSKPNGKLIYNSITKGPYVRRMIPELGYPNRDVPVAETFHEQTDDELTRKEEIWLRVQQMMKGSDIEVQEKKAKLFNEWEMFTFTDGELMESYYHRFSKLMNDFKRNEHFPEKIASNLKFLNNLQPEWSRHVTIFHKTKDFHIADYNQLYDFLKYNQVEVNELRVERLARTYDPLALMADSNNPYNYPNYIQQPMINPEDFSDLITAINMALVLIAKAFKLNYSTPTNNNQRISSNPRNRQIAQPVQNLGVQNDGNQNGLIVVMRIANPNANQNGNGNVIAARAKGNGNGNNGDLDEIKKFNANCILMANLQQASTSGTHTDKALVYDSDGSTEVHEYDNSYNNEIYNMFTQEEQYIELLEPSPEPHQVQQNDSNVISAVSSVEQSGGTVEQHPTTVEETRAYFESLYNNLAIKVEKVNTVNRK